jgi:hypothetical protein
VAKFMTMVSLDTPESMNFGDSKNWVT